MGRAKRYPKGTYMKLRSKDILRAIMEDKGFSMKRLATYSGKSKSFIGFLCTGDKTSCKPETADAIAEALGVPTMVLFVQEASAGSGHDAKGKVA